MSRISMKVLLNTFSMIIIIIAVFATIFYLKYDLESKVYTPLSESIMNEISQTGDFISMYFENEMLKLKTASSQITISSTNTIETLKGLKDTLKEFPEFEEFFVANSEGESISSSNIFTNISRYRYFRDIFNTDKKNSLSDLYISKISGNVAIILATSVEKNGKKYLFGGALNLKDLFSKIQKYKFKDYGEIFFIDKLGNYFSIKNEGDIDSGTFAKNFRDNIIRDLKNEEGYMEVKKNKENYYLFLSKISFLDWNIGYYVKKDMISPKFTKYYIYGGIFTLLLILFEILANHIVLKKRFNKSIDVLKSELKKLNELNFNSTNIIVKEPMFIDFTDNLQLTIVNLKENFESFSRKVNALEKFLAQNRLLINEELKRIGEEEETVEKLSKTFEAISKSISDSQKISESYKSKLNNYDDELEELRHILLKSKSKISYFSDLSKKLIDISEKVSDLSYRTEILSLNAALEASKEKSSLTFAVIAADMRDMSYTLKEFNNKTVSHVNHINENLSDYKENLNELFDNIDNNISELRKISGNFEEIETSIKEHNLSAAQIKNVLNLLKVVIGKNKNIMNDIVSNFEMIERNFKELKKAFVTKKATKNLEEIFQKLEEIEKKENIGSESNDENQSV
ncbi:hypothetical protein XO11_07215 [Marinitoga sp. 1138]|nr:hypothetical protein [Marinitoga sp. 1138]